MRGGEGFNGGEGAAERAYDPEVEELLEFLSVYKKIQEILAWLIEASPNSDPIIVGIRRALLNSLLQQLGLDPEDPDCIMKLEEIKAGLSDRTQNPKPRFDIPDADFFTLRIKEIIDDPITPHVEYLNRDNVNLIELAENGQIMWNEVESRSHLRTLGEYIHGLAQIMADPVAYQATFSGLGFNGSEQNPDHLAVNREWTIRNGRHRALAARSLGPEVVSETGMAQWIPISIEAV